MDVSHAVTAESYYSLCRQERGQFVYIILKHFMNCLTTRMHSISLILHVYKRFARINEKTVNITSGSSKLLRQNIVLIDFDERFAKIYLVFLMLLFKDTFFIQILSIYCQ